MSRSTDPFSSTRQVVRGPREPPPRPPRTAPPDSGCKKNRAIPPEKIHDVLLNPEAYAEMYPEIFPLTRKVYRQLRALGASHVLGGWVEGTADPIPRGRCGRQELETTTQEPFFDAGAGASPPSNGSQPRSFLDMTDDVFGTASWDSGPPHTKHCSHAQVGTTRNVLDLIERGEWEAVPQVSVTWTVNVAKS
ncbi:hypothetical protein C8T65DRAFT_63388 [Cerioporus squamosus]|nr:hypothetical protein C8T65DRAFT_63388 [Cerioporus squamosus]